MTKEYEVNHFLQRVFCCSIFPNRLKAKFGQQQGLTKYTHQYSQDSYLGVQNLSTSVLSLPACCCLFCSHLILQCWCTSGTWRYAASVSWRSTVVLFPRESQTLWVYALCLRHRGTGSYRRWRKQTSVSPGSGTGRAGKALAGPTERKPMITYKKLN